jgi:hypothetical protein
VSAYGLGELFGIGGDGVDEVAPLNAPRLAFEAFALD